MPIRGQGQPGGRWHHAHQPEAEACVGLVRVNKVTIQANADAVVKVPAFFQRHVIDAVFGNTVPRHRCRRVIAAIDGERQAVGHLVGAVRNLVGKGVKAQMPVTQGAGEGDV